MDEKKCIDCTYFKEYYVKMKTRFYSTCTGHCLKAKRNKLITQIDTACGFYNQKDKKAEKESVLKYLKDYLAKVANQLNDLKQLLKDDSTL